MLNGQMFHNGSSLMGHSGWLVSVFAVMLVGVVLARLLQRRSTSPFVQKFAPLAVTMTVLATLVALGMMLTIFLAPDRTAELPMASSIASVIMGLAALLIAAMVVAAATRWFGREKR